MTEETRAKGKRRADKDIPPHELELTVMKNCGTQLARVSPAARMRVMRHLADAAGEASRLANHGAQENGDDGL